MILHRAGKQTQCSIDIAHMQLQDLQGHLRTALSHMLHGVFQFDLYHGTKNELKTRQPVVLFRIVGFYMDCSVFGTVLVKRHSKTDSRKRTPEKRGQDPRTR